MIICWCSPPNLKSAVMTSHHLPPPSNTHNGGMSSFCNVFLCFILTAIDLLPLFIAKQFMVVVIFRLSKGAYAQLLAGNGQIEVNVNIEWIFGRVPYICLES